MRNLRRLAASLALAAAGLACAPGCRREAPPAPARPEPRLEPLISSGEEAPPAVPPGSVALDANGAEAVAEPFRLGEDPTAAAGFAILLPEGAASPGQSGEARFRAEIPAPGEYRAWVRARWSDSCGNSLLLAVDDRPGQSAGQDSVFGAWHWVPAGAWSLEAGAHQVRVLEREDGVAFDQILLTPDARFRPAGPILASGAGIGLLLFRDDFMRSPGHGSEAWDFESGKWEIAFSLDPNRIPNQYSLVGACTNANRPAVAWIRDLSWQGSHVVVSVFPAGTASFGVLLGRAPERPRLKIAVRVNPGDSRLEIAGPRLRETAALGDRVRPNQWHRFEIETRASALAVKVDGETVYRSLDVEPASGAVGFTVEEGVCALDEVEVTEIRRQAETRHGGETPNPFRLGPFHFTHPSIEDPTDYLDFTPEEYSAIRRSPEEEKFRREKKMKDLLGHGDDAVWRPVSGDWAIRDGYLAGHGPSAVLRFGQEIAGDMDLRFRIRGAGGAGRCEVELYAGRDPGVVVSLGGDANAPLLLDALADGRWHDVAIRVHGSRLEVACDGRPRMRSLTAMPMGDAVQFRVTAGEAHFDDIEFLIPRSGARGFFYPFDQRETDWWRDEGDSTNRAQWVDHSGVTCVSASSWVSLLAPSGRGVLWNKRSFPPDLLVAFNIEEQTEWFGWNRRPDHVHHPMDNVFAILQVGGRAEQGYRLEVNSRNRSRTVLYRNGIEAVSVAQDESFPIRFAGDHAMYRPRRNRIALLKRGGLLQAVVNGREVLRFEDPDPLPVDRVGIGGYNTRVNFTHVDICPLPAEM